MFLSEAAITLAAMSIVALRLKIFNGVPWKFGFLCLLEAIDIMCDHVKQHPTPKERRR